MRGGAVLVYFNPIIVLFLTNLAKYILLYLNKFQSYYSLIFNSTHKRNSDPLALNFNPIIVLFLTRHISCV